MDKITFLYESNMFDFFIPNGLGSFLSGKRPIYPQYGDDSPSCDYPKDLPLGFLPVLMRFDDKNFISIDDSQRLQIKLPAEGDESVHAFEGVEFNEGENYYFFFTEAELSAAEFEIARKMGFNYWNPKGLRWEPRGHVLENYWADHRFYVVSNGYVAVCYTKNDDSVCSNHPGLPVFEQNIIIFASSFNEFFGHPQYIPRQDFDFAYFFIEFSLDELRACGIEVPAELTGYRFDPESAIFCKIEKPTTPCGWDWITQFWQPICLSENDEGHMCGSQKLTFPWDSTMSNWILNVQNVYTCMTQDIGDAKRNTTLMRNFFSQNGGPYCDCNCFCDNCRNFHLPWERSKHSPFDGNDILSRWTCD